MGEQVIVGPTSHLDWNWTSTFREYALNGPDPNGSVNCWSSTTEVLRRVVNCLHDTTSEFQFSIAEVAYLRALAVDDPTTLTALAAAGPDRLVVMGGGITSPDNLLCHGEVFIRNYLLGRRWLRANGFAGHVQPIAWLPDDFGHDPQLPVVIAAMGFTAVGLSRVPGSSQGTTCAAPIAGGPNEAQRLTTEVGLVFDWVAADGSTVLTHYMPGSYGAPFYVDGGTEAVTCFIDTYATGWPVVDGAPLRFEPVGGDFADPSDGGATWNSVIDDYNHGNGNGPPAVTASCGTFADYMTRASTATRNRYTLQAQNYWTGFFCSRPRLKAQHHAAARHLLAAEATSALLRVATCYSAAALDALDDAIGQGWEALVPSSHHDFVTGTAPDRVYWIEQAPLLDLAVDIGRAAAARATTLLAGAVEPRPATGEVPFVVMNPLGFARPLGNLVELPAAIAPPTAGSVRVGTAEHVVQRLPDGGLLLDGGDQQVPGFGYVTAYVRPGDTVGADVDGGGRGALPPPATGKVTITNGLLSVVVSQADGWAITSCRDLSESTELIPPNGLANALRAYADDGNLYQFGNEPLTCPPDSTKVFEDTDAPLAGDPATWIEQGPLRWRLRAPVRVGDLRFVVEYELWAREPIVRIRVTGAAPAAATPGGRGTSIVARFDLHAAAGSPSTLVHGTANHWIAADPVAYWHGPTFQATHDYVLPGPVERPVAMVVHGGVPAWAIDPADGCLLAALLRNAPGRTRGAAGTDIEVHTVEYAYGFPYDAAADGSALRAARAYATPLLAAPVGTDGSAARALPDAGQLAATDRPDAVLRSARVREASTSKGAGDWPQPEVVDVVVGVALPSATAGRNPPVTVTLPLPGGGSLLGAARVTALEDHLETLQPSGGAVTFTPAGALSTLLLTVQRPPTTPDSGKEVTSGLREGR